MESFTFRTATAKDATAINLLAKKIWNAHYPDIISQSQIDFMLEKMYSQESILKQMQEKHNFLLAFFENTLIGYCATYKTDANTYFLDKLYVDISQHKMGIGIKLLDKSIKQMDNPKSLKLQVNRKNFKAINFYFKNGFVIEDAKDIDIGSGFQMQDFIMVKKLKQPGVGH